MVGKAETQYSKKSKKFCGSRIHSTRFSQQQKQANDDFTLSYFRKVKTALCCKVKSKSCKTEYVSKYNTLNCELLQHWKPQIYLQYRSLSRKLFYFVALMGFLCSCSCAVTKRATWNTARPSRQWPKTSRSNTSTQLRRWTHPMDSWRHRHGLRVLARQSAQYDSRCLNSSTHFAHDKNILNSNNSNNSSNTLNKRTRITMGLAPTRSVVQPPDKAWLSSNWQRKKKPSTDYLLTLTHTDVLRAVALILAW